MQTERLTLRRFCASDAQSLASYLSDPEVVRFEPYGPLDPAQCRDAARTMAASADYWAVCLRGEGEDELIGQVFLAEREAQRWELGYVFRRDRWGRGFAAEAAGALLGRIFTDGDAHRVFARCSPDNTRSLRLLERLGFRREALHRQDTTMRSDRAGRPVWQDTCVYALLREEWPDRAARGPLDLERTLAFLAEAEALKSTLRTAWTATGRPESTAEHSWRVALFCWALAEAWERPVDLARVLLLSLVHDLGELDTGDVSAALHPDAGAKEDAERAAIDRLAALLPPGRGGELRALWAEYQAAETDEAKLVRMLDKAETILQHTQGDNEPVIDYRFNLDYGRAYFPDDGPFAALRAMLDARTEARLREEESRDKTGPRFPGGPPEP